MANFNLRVTSSSRQGNIEGDSDDGSHPVQEG